MAMKLLEKKQIDVLKAQEFVAERAEGAKLAARVDTLREIQAQEEASLEKFRRETLSKLNAEIVSKVSERDAITYEVHLLEQARELAKKPLIAETTTLELSRSALRKETEDLKHRKVEVAASERRLQDQEIANNTEKTRITAERQRTTEILSESDNDRKTAATLLVEAETMKAASARFQETLKQEFIHRDMQLAARERDCTIREDSLTQREEEVRVKKIQVADREQTLITELARLKQ